LSCLCHVFVCFYWFLCCVLCPMLLVPPVCPLLIASSSLSSVYIFHGNMYLQNLRIPVLHVQKVSLTYICLSFYINIKIIGHRKINDRVFIKIQILQYFNKDWF
jgi:hypothetical protein